MHRLRGKIPGVGQIHPSWRFGVSLQQYDQIYDKATLKCHKCYTTSGSKINTDSGKYCPSRNDCEIKITIVAVPARCLIRSWPDDGMGMGMVEGVFA